MFVFVCESRDADAELSGKASPRSTRLHNSAPPLPQAGWYSLRRRSGTMAGGVRRSDEVTALPDPLRYHQVSRRRSQQANAASFRERAWHRHPSRVSEVAPWTGSVQVRLDGGVSGLGHDGVA